MSLTIRFTDRLQMHRPTQFCWDSKSITDITSNETQLSNTRLVLNLSIITANLPGLKSLLYDLQTGQSGLRLEEQAARWEVESQHAPSDGTAASTNGIPQVNGTGSQHQSQRARAGRFERCQPEMSAQNGILRTVDIAVSVESREQPDVEKLGA